MNDPPDGDRADLAALRGAFPALAAPQPLCATSAVVQWCVTVPADTLLDVAAFLRADDACRYAQLCDLTCVDYLHFPDARDRYGVVYSLLSLADNRRVWLKVFVNDPAPTVPSVTGVWRGAEWLEREVFDLFGVAFTGHPDLRRIVTWDAFEGHPLRKDYPLRGRGERDRFETITRESE